MTNNAWNRLCNEWNANRCNNEFEKFCNRVDIDPYIIKASQTDDMKKVRTEMKKQYVWLEDECEADLYVELMPFGGHTKESLAKLKDALKVYRNSGKRNPVYRELMVKEVYNDQN